MDIDPLPAVISLLANIEPLSLEIGPMGSGQLWALIAALACLIVSGFVSGSEIAYFSLTQQELSDLEEGSTADTIRRFLSNPQRLLATILIANNLVNVTIVILCNYSLGPVFSGMGEVLSFLLQTVLLTFIILLFGEIVPKLISNSFPLQWARAAVPGIKVLWVLFSPVARMLVRGGSVVNRVVSKEVPEISTSELSRALEITQGTSGDDKEMLEGILRFGGTTASEVMTPRVDITWLEEDMDFDTVLREVRSSGYSRMPVAGESQDDVKGVLYARDLLPYIGREVSDGFRWTQLLRQAYFVPESRMIDDLLEDFRRLKIHMAVVVDEYGGTQGLVTLEDVLEEIVGDIDDEYDEPDSTFKRLRDDTYIFEGRTPLTDFFRITDLNPEDYEEVTQDVETLAGMLLAIKGDFPKEKEPLVYGRCRFLILDITDHRIAEVRLKVMPDIQTEVK